jgi:hypothetical protein
LSAEILPKKQEVEIATQTQTEPKANGKTENSENKVSSSLQEIVASLKSVSDDIGQICELGSEEKLLVAAFFSSLCKLMRPLSSAIPVSPLAIPETFGTVAKSYIDPTGHLSVVFKDGHFELENLVEEKNRDLMIAVVEDILPKFKVLTAAQKRNLESRMEFMSIVTKEMQKISDALVGMSPEQEE